MLRLLDFNIETVRGRLTCFNQTGLDIQYSMICASDMAVSEASHHTASDSKAMAALAWM